MNTPAFLKRPFERWLDKRLVKSLEHTLNYRQIFVLPSREGIVFIVLTLLIWLMGTNYENNLVLATAYWLVALFVFSLLQAYYNLAGLSISLTNVEPGYVEQMGRINVLIKPKAQQNHHALRVYFNTRYASTIRHVSLPQPLSIELPLIQRGYSPINRLTIETTYPTGLIRAWSLVDFNEKILAYPKRLASALEPKIVEGDNSGAQHQYSNGVAEFSDIKAYQPGDSPKRIAWKHYSRTEQLATKQFVDEQSQSVWLTWAQCVGVDTETRLSHLSDAISNLPITAVVGLRLPNITIQPASGKFHQQVMLSALALFNLSNAQ